ncbi:MAG TPA: hypothetical protein VEZ71_05025 [Archangium sp.]|nr:hypothetical protein [Archangium sp.]
MALLKLNGVDVEATASEWEPVTLGEMTRSLNGAPRTTAKVRKKNLRYTSSLLTVPHAQALRGLIEGDGHVLSFEDTSSPTAYLYTSRETPPLAAAGVSRDTELRNGINEDAVLVVPGGAYPTWELGDLSTATYLFWVKAQGPGSDYPHLDWTHFIYRSDGAYWRDGILSAPAADDTFYPDAHLLAEFAEGVLTLGAQGGIAGERRYAEVVVLPYLIPEEWGAGMHAFHAARAWPRLPGVHAVDPRLPAGGLLCQGEVGTSKAMHLRGSVGEVFDFTLYGT